MQGLKRDRADILSQPISYSANGSHANYATSGSHEIDLGNSGVEIFFIDDHTDDGYFWDPTLSAYWYSYDNSTEAFTAYDSSYPTDWLEFEGMCSQKHEVGACQFLITVI
jgi:hypothetical protein